MWHFGGKAQGRRLYSNKRRTFPMACSYGHPATNHTQSKYPSMSERTVSWEPPANKALHGNSTARHVGKEIGTVAWLSSSGEVIRS